MLSRPVESFEGVDMEAAWAKSTALFDLFAALMEERCPSLECISPRDPSLRGSLGPFVMASYNSRVVRRSTSLRSSVEPTA